jgi:hypothetical protein
MSLSNAVIKTAPTSIATTGGTDLTYASLGNSAPGVLELYVPADTDFRIRRSLTVSIKSPKLSVNAPNGYTQQRVKMLYRKPKLLANGKYTVQTCTVEVAYDIEASQADIQDLIDTGAQLCFDADFTPSFKAASLS